MWRVRAHLRFTLASGLGTWCFNQNVVRLTQASHLLHPSDPQRPDELSSHIVDADGTYRCDLIFTAGQQALAVDTFNTITAASVIHPANLRPVVNDVSSWSNVHECHHDKATPDPCTNVTHAWSET